MQLGHILFHWRNLLLQLNHAYHIILRQQCNSFLKPHSNHSPHESHRLFTIIAYQHAEHEATTLIAPENRNSQEHAYHKGIMRTYKSHMTPKIHIRPTRNSWSENRIIMEERDADVEISSSHAL